MLLKRTTRSPKTGKSYKFKIDDYKKKIIEKRGGRAINFIMALFAIKNGIKITKISWNESNSYIYLEDGILKHNQPHHKGQKKHGSGYPYVMGSSDLFDEDWMTYDE